jgi:hypothetical protein
MLALIDISGTPQLREAADIYRRHQRRAFDATRKENKPMQYPPKPKTTTKAVDTMSPGQLERRWDQLLGADTPQPQPRLTPREVTDLLLEDYNEMTPREQREYRGRVQTAMDAMVAADEAEAAQEYQRKNDQLSRSGEQAYRERSRLMNDRWTETNEDGTTTSFVGSLHEDKVSMYRGR